MDYPPGDGIHTDGTESWAILERGVYGIFYNVSVRYMQKYADEFCYRLNRRNDKEAFEALTNLAVKWPYGNQACRFILQNGWNAERKSSYGL